MLNITHVFTPCTSTWGRILDYCLWDHWLSEVHVYICTHLWNSNLPPPPPPRHIKLSFFYATVDTVLLYGCECSTLKPNPAEVSGWVLHENAACSTKHQPERACYQQASVWGATKSEWENSNQENEAGRSLPETPGATSQQTGAMGANTWVSITRASHTNVRRRTKERYRSRKHWRANQVHGGSKWLEATMVGSSEDDLERWNDWKRRWWAHLRMT